MTDAAASQPSLVWLEPGFAALPPTLSGPVPRMGLLTRRGKVVNVPGCVCHAKRSRPNTKLCRNTCSTARRLVVSSTTKNCSAGTWSRTAVLASCRAPADDGPPRVRARSTATLNLCWAQRLAPDLMREQFASSMILSAYVPTACAPAIRGHSRMVGAHGAFCCDPTGVATTAFGFGQRWHVDGRDPLLSSFTPAKPAAPASLMKRYSLSGAACAFRSFSPGSAGRLMGSSVCCVPPDVPPSRCGFVLARAWVRFLRQVVRPAGRFGFCFCCRFRCRFLSPLALAYAFAVALTTVIQQ